MIKIISTKTFLKSFRYGPVIVTKKFLNSLQTELMEILLQVYDEYEPGQVINKITVNAPKFFPEPFLIKKKSIRSFFYDMLGPVKIAENFYKELNSYIVAICKETLLNTNGQAVIDLFLPSNKFYNQVPVIKNSVEKPIPKIPQKNIMGFSKSPESESLYVTYYIRIQRKIIYGSQHIFTTNDINKIKQVIENNITRQFEFLGIHNKPFITIQAIEKRVKNDTESCTI